MTIVNVRQLNNDKLITLPAQLTPSSTTGKWSSSHVTVDLLEQFAFALMLQNSLTLGSSSAPIMKGAAHFFPASPWPHTGGC